MAPASPFIGRLAVTECFLKATSTGFRSVFWS